MGPRGIALALMLGASVARADYDPSQYPPYETCALCHGLFGQSDRDRFPNLGGQKPAYLEAQIRSFRAGQRTNDGGQMAAIASELRPEDIPVVVAWFAGQDAPRPYPAPDTATGAARYYELGCGGCHGLSVEEDPFVPHLSAQHPAYLVKQMTDFRDGARVSPVAPEGHGPLLALPDDEIAALARYLGAQARP